MNANRLLTIAFDVVVGVFAVVSMRDIGRILRTEMRRREYEDTLDEWAEDLR